ncbi:MAG: hypothetical protein WC455_28460 [Dehalococcoidia bacterium]
MKNIIENIGETTEIIFKNNTEEDYPMMVQGSIAISADRIATALERIADAQERLAEMMVENENDFEEPDNGPVVYNFNYQGEYNDNPR